MRSLARVWLLFQQKKGLPRALIIFQRFCVTSVWLHFIWQLHITLFYLFMGLFLLWALFSVAIQYRNLCIRFDSISSVRLSSQTLKCNWGRITMTINKLLQGTFCEIGRQIPRRGKFPMEFLFWLACDSRSKYDPFPVLPLPFAFLFGSLSSSISSFHFPFFKCEISNFQYVNCISEDRYLARHSTRHRTKWYSIKFLVDLMICAALWEYRSKK